MQSAGFRDVTAIAVLGKSWGGRVDERGARSKGQRKIKTQASTGVTGRPTNPLAPPTHMRALFRLVISAPPRGRHGDWTRHDEVLEAQESRCDDSPPPPAYPSISLTLPPAIVTSTSELARNEGLIV
ncbi:hypothetical protein C0Q70_15340 [Pomacea canaliculata]|uniref:Uncharacterized protein n=1 Tax=Pomacea canaliculata TaxID=400727 RepID=A0A2T7NUL0_POMCA|nr:hypothetical protein C0Q70_15340 [Pomacea canaliculata]